MSNIIIFTVKELSEWLEERRLNQFDSNFLVTGGTGLGKSTIIWKLLRKFKDKGYRPMKHQIYDRESTISLLRDNKLSYCWNDELISAAYRREHWDREQIELIKTLTKYRCNFNIFAGALPVFFTLDKELLKLFSLNIDVIRRGESVVHMRREGRRYNDDPWDVKYNAKLEDGWSKSLQKNPNFKIPYHKYSTFVGYLFFKDLTPKQRARYEYIRDLKKNRIEQAKNEENESVKPFYDKLYIYTINKQLNEETLRIICDISNKNIVAVKCRLNQMLRNTNHSERVRTLVQKPLIINESNKEILNELVI
jgi:hypothetical protein